MTLDRAAIEDLILALPDHRQVRYELGKPHIQGPVEDETCSAAHAVVNDEHYSFPETRITHVPAGNEKLAPAGHGAGDVRRGQEGFPGPTDDAYILPDIDLCCDQRGVCANHQHDPCNRYEQYEKHAPIGSSGSCISPSHSPV